MKFITQLENDADFLKALYEVAEQVNVFIDKTGIMEIRKRMPVLQLVPKLPSDDMTTEEKAEAMKIRLEAIKNNEKAMNDQLKKNIMEILKQVCKEYPDDFVSLMHKIIVLDEGEEYPHGLALFTVAIKAFTNKEMFDFFTELTALGSLISE